MRFAGVLFDFDGVLVGMKWAIFHAHCHDLPPDVYTRCSGSEFGGGSSSIGDDWKILNRFYWLNSRPGNSITTDVDAFLKDARLYIIGTRYGGTISLPYDVPEMLLE